jgi:succinoglycan biosynthesis protein ExoM
LLHSKISICIPTYNRAMSLKRCLESLHKLTYDNVEIIVGDNNSTDNTKEIVQAFPAVRYVSETSQGAGFMRNVLLHACSEDSEYIGYIDDDEEVEPTWVEDMLCGFAADPEVVTVGGPYRPIYAKAIPTWMPDNVCKRKFEERTDVVVTDKFPSIPGGNCMLRLAVVRKKNVEFDTALGRKGKRPLSGEDNEFLQKVTEPEYKYAFVHKAWVYHHIPAERMTFTFITRLNFWDSVSEYCYRKKAFTVWLKNLYKLITRTIQLVVSIFTLNPRYITNRYLKVVRCLGYLLGPHYK